MGFPWDAYLLHVSLAEAAGFRYRRNSTCVDVCRCQSLETEVHLPALFRSHLVPGVTGSRTTPQVQKS